MKLKLIVVQILLIKMLMLLECIECGVIVTAPYQVSIRYNDLYPDINDPDVILHTCNGAIVHEKYILTTANCVYAQVMQTNISRPINPTLIYVMAGNLTGGTVDGVRRNVVSVIPHTKFNPITYQNDIALLKLDRSLPLSNSTFVQWIELQQKNDLKIGANCFVNNFNYSADPSSYPYTQIQNATSFDNWVCNSQQINYNNLSRSNDLCLQYALDSDYLCNVTSNVLKYTGERGASLVCGNKLTGILAEINPARNVNYCLQSHKTTAYYIKIASYIDWIYTEIGLLKPDPNTKLPPLIPSPFIEPPTTAPGTNKQQNQKSNAITSRSNEIQLILILVNLPFLYNRYFL